MERRSAEGPLGAHFHVAALSLPAFSQGSAGQGPGSAHVRMPLLTSYSTGAASEGKASSKRVPTGRGWGCGWGWGRGLWKGEVDAVAKQQAEE